MSTLNERLQAIALLHEKGYITSKDAYKVLGMDFGYPAAHVIYPVDTSGWNFEFSFPDAAPHDADPAPPPPAPLRCRCGVLRDTLIPWPEGSTDGRRMCTSCGWQGTP